MTYRIELQFAVDTKDLPTKFFFRKCAKQTLMNKVESAELTIRVVNSQESTHLNNTYRKKNKPTNVLAFPFEAFEDEESNILGDLVVCAPVVIEEAKTQQKEVQAHFAHLVVHGTLHLLGYDHISDADATKMEREEIKILAELGFKNPYEKLPD